MYLVFVAVCNLVRRLVQILTVEFAFSRVLYFVLLFLVVFLAVDTSRRPDSEAPIVQAESPCLGP